MLVSVAVSLLTIGANASPEEQAFRILSPAGGGRHPAVLLVPGCSGFNATDGVNVYEERAAELHATGNFIVFVDYIERRVQTNCAHVAQAEVAQDILEAAARVRQRPNVDTNRVSVIGWSFGAGGVLAAVKAMPPDPPIGKAVMYYPICRGAVPWSASVASLILLGAKDDVAKPSLCKPVIDGVPAERLRVVTYSDARHGFDNRGFPDRADQPGAPVYDAEAAKASWAAVLEFLKQQ